MTGKYSNCKIHFVTLEGDTLTDQAVEMWNNMDWNERLAVMNQVDDFSGAVNKRYMACINYIAEYMVK